MKNNRTTSHRKITTYRLSPEMNTDRNSKQTTCLCRDTWGKGTLPFVRSFVLFLLNVLRCQKHIRDNL